jgi:hypothetical protein
MRSHHSDKERRAIFITALNLYNEEPDASDGCLFRRVFTIHNGDRICPYAVLSCRDSSAAVTPLLKPTKSLKTNKEYSHATVPSRRIR